VKAQEIKTEFIRLRAEGKSYSVIAESLQISKSTCTAWERELKDRITELKQEQLNELYNQYYMTREARIRQLGETLESINTALDGIDLTTIAPEKLLDFKLKYTEALKGEFTGTAPAYMFEESIEPRDIISALGDLLNRIRAGEVTTEQASRESLVIGNLLKAYEAAEIKAKIDALEAIVGGRILQ
jgi:transposase